jgi:signal recognition particle GTPase
MADEHNRFKSLLDGLAEDLDYPLEIHLDSPKLSAESTKHPKIRCYFYGLHKGKSSEYKINISLPQYDIGRDPATPDRSGEPLVVMGGYGDPTENDDEHPVFVLWDDTLYGRYPDNPYNLQVSRDKVKAARESGFETDHRNAGCGGETVIIADEENLVEALSLRARLTQVRSILERELPDTFRPSYAPHEKMSTTESKRAQTVERVVDTFLQETSGKLTDRRKESQSIIQKQKDSVDLTAIEKRCGEELFAPVADSDGTNFQTDYFEPLLAKIEEGWEGTYIFSDVDYTVEFEPANEYDTINAATDDIVERLTDHGRQNWVTSEAIKSAVTDWTKIIRRNDPDDKQISPNDLAVLREISTLYETREERLEELATMLGAGEIDDSNLEPKKVVFTALLRDLQREAGADPNITPEKIDWVLSEDLAERNLSGEKPPNNADEIARQLSQAKQLVFHGPPGTGKTYTARKFARWWLNKEDANPTTNQLKFVTFHPSFSYEDFIEGISAKSTGDGVTYGIDEGVFRTFAERAKVAYNEDTENPSPYVLIIDEINRGNLAQIFGESITLLEPDKRLDETNENNITLPNSGTEFVVPPNLYVIGTMNTADRSIALVDAALRRRFRFIHFDPDMTTIYGHYDDLSVTGSPDAREALRNHRLFDPVHEILTLSALCLEEVNSTIRDSQTLERGQQIGHSYLLGMDRDSDIDTQIQQITDIWKYEILPLLEEYYYGDFEGIDQLFSGDVSALIDTDRQIISDFGPEALVASLLDTAFTDESLSEEAENRIKQSVKDAMT